MPTATATAPPRSSSHGTESEPASPATHPSPPRPTSRDIEVPLLDLVAQYQSLRDEILPVMERVLEGQQLINGPEVRVLEEAVADYSQCKAAVGVSSGTDALVCGLMALEIGPGDEVITSPYTFFATGGSIWRVGAKPVFVDIDPLTYNLDADQLDAAVTDATRAIMPVHLFGQCADMDAVTRVAKRHGLWVIEDAAQSIGATQHGQPAGSMSTMGCFSFFPSKNLGGAGDGGMIVTQDDSLAEKLAVFRNHGAKPKYFHHYVGGNFRLDTLQAAYLSVKLPHLDAWSDTRRENGPDVRQTARRLRRCYHATIMDGNVSIYNQYVIRSPRRDELQQYLTDHAIGTAVYYPVPLHLQACFSELGHKPGDFPESERAALETLALPIYPELTPEQIEHVAARVREFHD